MLIAARLSGSGQDKELKETEKSVSQADAELARISVQKQRSKMLGAEKASSLLVDDGASMPIARLQAELEQLRSVSKEEIKVLRMRIREEADQHKEYGMQVQNAVQAKLNEAVASKGRTRRKITDIKSNMKAGGSGYGGSGSTNSKAQGKGRPASPEQKKVASTEGFSGRNPNAIATQPAAKPSSATSKTRTRSPAQTSRPSSKPKPKATAKDSRFDKQIDRMEVESEKALSGLDDLLAEMEHEDALKVQHDDDYDDLGNNNDLLVVNTAHLRNKAIALKSVPVMNKPATSKAPAPAPVAVAVAVVAAPTLDSDEEEEEEEKEEENEKGEEEEEEEEEDDIDIPTSESPLKMKVAAGSLSSRRLPPQGEAPKSSQLLPSPMKPKPPNEFATGIALRGGSLFDDDNVDDRIGRGESPPKFDNSDSDREEEEEEEEEDRDRPDSAATNVTNTVDNVVKSRPTTANSAYDLEEEDEELSSLLRKYPGQDPGNDEDEDDEEDGDGDRDGDEEDESDNSRPGSKGAARRNKIPPGYPPGSFDFETAEDFPVKKVEKPVWKSVKPASIEIDTNTADSVPVKQSPEQKQASPGTAVVSTKSERPLSSTGSPTHKSGKTLSLPVIPNVPAITRTSPLSKSTLAPTSAPVDVGQSVEVESNSKMQKKLLAAEDDENEEDSEDQDADAEGDESANEQLNALRRHARVLEKLNDLAQADKMYRRCLEIDPMDVKSLQSYAIFLHQKRGDMSLAQGFFTRAIQVCLPGFLNQDGQIKSESNGGQDLSPTKIAALNVKAPSQLPQGRLPEGGGDGLRIQHVARLLVKYGDFEARAKGDSSNAIRAYRKAIELHPSNTEALTTLAHFLSEEGDAEHYGEAINLFARAMRASPDNAVYALKYARLLKKAGQLGKADLMYQVARTHSKGNAKLEASAICNYATFVCRQRKNVSHAQTLFLEGLSLHPDHKGLLKNYTILLKANPSFGDASSLQSPKRSPKRNKENRENTPEKNFKTEGKGNGESANSEVLTPPVSTKRAVAKVHARMLLSTSGAPVDASVIVEDAETPSKLKDDYTASLENVRKSVKSFQEEESAAFEAKQKKEMKEKSLAELSLEFNSFFDSTNNNSVDGDIRHEEEEEEAQAGIYKDEDNLSEDEEDDDSDTDLYSHKRPLKTLSV